MSATGFAPTLLQVLPRKCACVRISADDFGGDGHDADDAEEEEGKVKSVGPMPHPLHGVAACAQYLRTVGAMFHFFRSISRG